MLARYRPVIRLVSVIALMIILALCWRYLAGQGLITPDRLVNLITELSALQRTPWLLPLIIVIYVVALLLMFPLTVLVVVTAMLFGPWWGLLYAGAGTLSSSAVTFWVGRMLGEAPLQRYSGRYVTSLRRYMGERSIRSMIVINLLPLAPFTFTNLMAGAFSLPFPRYMLGSAIGIIPGLAVVTLLGGQLGRILLAEDRQEVWMAVGIGIALLIVFLAIRWIWSKKFPARSQNRVV
ncbi:MAG: VTT domain-containing protein [Pseudohongiella sp.]